MAYGWGDYEFPQAQMGPAIQALSTIHSCALYTYPQLSVAQNAACSSAELISPFERYGNLKWRLFLIACYLYYGDGTSEAQVEAAERIRS